MNIKKYRAATTREALEQIKLDLGEDALVLETRQIRKGGFLGFGSQTQIEISAAVAAATEKPAAKTEPKAAEEYNRRINILHLTDDAPAAPPPIDEREKLLNGLKTHHATATRDFTPRNSFAASSGILGTVPRRAVFSPIEAVEINPSAPRVVHLKKETPPPAAADEQIFIEKKTVETPTFSTPAATTPATNREFELLRAELREVKFSLSSLATRQNCQPDQSESNSEFLGDVLESPFYECYGNFISKGIAPELARLMTAHIIPQYKNGSISAAQIPREALTQAVNAAVKFEPNPMDGDERVILALIGATGVGKTTTIAKLAAWMALRKRRPVELITLDTYRIAAVEQLKTYAVIIGAGCHVVRSISELETVLRRLPVEASVFIDTTGKNPHDLADQYEISDYLAQRTEIRKCLAVQATTHPLDGIAAIKKFEMYGADCLALTKLDETLRPGAMLELAAESSLPLVYFSTGQRVPEDFQAATPENFVSRILGE